jgi:hypothetical protein
MGRKTAPTPLILQLIKAIFRICTIAVKLTHTVYWEVAVRDQHDVLPWLHFLIGKEHILERFSTLFTLV